MKKYKPANLQSVNEFIQRMINGEKFYRLHTDGDFCFCVRSSSFFSVPIKGEIKAFLPWELSDIETLSVEVNYTIQDALAEEPRLCWVWNHEGINPKEYLQIIECYDSSKAHPFRCASGGYLRAELATLDDIKQFLED